jgi:hypothetical protein
MNRKQFIILLALVVVIGTAGLIVRQRGRDSWQNSSQSTGRKLLPSLPVNDIAQITIESGTNELNLAKRDNIWRVRERGDYPADFSQISELVLKFADLKIVQAEEIGPSQLGRLELLPPGLGTNAATLVEFKDQSGKTINSILLGKKHMRRPAGNSGLGGMGEEGWPDGRYVMAGAGKTVAVISDALDKAEPKPESWLNKDFFSVEKPSSISVQFPEATNSWKLTRVSETNDWQLAGARPGEKLDSSKISSVTSPFSSPGFNDVSPAAAGLTNATLLKVETFDGFAYTAKIGPKAGDDYPVNFFVIANLPASRTPAKSETPEEKSKLDTEFKERQKSLADKLAREKQFENWVYSVPASVVDPVITPRIELLAEVKTEAETNAPAATEK